MKALLVAALAGLVQDCKECGGGAGLDLPGLGVVHECQLESGELELCWRDDDSDALQLSLYEHGVPVIACRPTSRHLGPCRWSHACTHAGAQSNALNGPWCPEEDL